MEMTREEARKAVDNISYSHVGLLSINEDDTRNFTRERAEDYIHDDDRVFWLLKEVQKEIEISKQYRWEKFTECGLTLSRAVPIEEPVSS